MRRSHFLQEIERLKPGVTLEQAESDVTMVARQLEKQYPESNTNFGLGPTLLPERLVGEMRLTLLLLAGAVGLVLLIACAYVANLTPARDAARHREIAIRTALGGLRDPEVSRQQLEEWRQHTRAAFSLRMLPDDHFFINPATSLVFRIVAQELYEHVR